MTANSNHNKASTETLENLHNALTEALLSKIKDGSATAADLAVARALLKDNGIDAIATEGNGLGTLAKSLPFQPIEQEEESEHL